jgi:hypothetical protein
MPDNPPLLPIEAKVGANDVTTFGVDLIGVSGVSICLEQTDCSD